MLISSSNMLIISKSPSPRRAWIEMQYRFPLHASSLVALPTEGVD